jgi:hypothetical protein
MLRSAGSSRTNPLRKRSPHDHTRKRSRRINRRTHCLVEALEDRFLLSAVSWIGGSGSWNTPSNWSTNTLPQPGDDVTISQAGNIQVTLAGSASIHSLSITGDSLSLSGGTLAVAGNVNNSGSITVNPLATLGVGGALSQSAGSSLTLPPGALASGVGNNLLTNPGLELPSAAGSSTVYPTGWGFWNTSYLSTQFAHTGTQSDQQTGPNSGINQSFTATPGVSYTASVYAMTPSTNKLTGPQEGILNLLFYDVNNNLIAQDGITVLTSHSAAGGPIAGSVGNQGWNFFSTSGVAPAGAVTVDIALQVGPYSGISGTAGGSVYWDDAQFGPTASTAAVVNAASVSSSGTITVGASDKINVTGTFLQTSTGTLISQLGGAPASLMFGTLNAGNATFAGTLQAVLVNGYTPAVNDGFQLLNYSSESGAFSTVQLPSASSYAFAVGVNPTYLGISALPVSTTTTVNANSVVGSSSTNFLGVNLAWWDNQLMTPQTESLVQAAGLSIFRFPGGSTADDFHFANNDNYLDSAANSIPQFARFTDSVGGQGMITIDYGSGSPQEAVAELAYLTGSPTDTTVIGNGIQWNDTTNAWQMIDWGTVGYWAGLRASSPLAQDDGRNFLRIGQAAPFTGMTYWEVANEEYILEEIDHHGTPAFGNSTGAPHDPATYAQFAATFASLVAADPQLPKILIGIDSGDPTGASDNNWTKNVLADGFADGFVPGFVSDHSYMQAPGYESDSFLLNHTVSDPASMFDWTTRNTTYRTLLNQTLGSTNATAVQVMATEYNSVYTNPGKQSTSLVNGLFVADSIGSLLQSGYTAGLVWDLRNGYLTNDNNNLALYGWRQLGDYGLLGDPNTTNPPFTGAYIPYPTYFAEQLASKMVTNGGQVVSATSNYGEISSYPVLEPNGHLELMIINKNPDAAVTEQFNLQGFAGSGQAQFWQYSEVQDNAQSQSSTGASSLASFSGTVNLNNGSFTYTLPAYSMTVVDLTPAVPFAVQTGSTLNIGLGTAGPVSIAGTGPLTIATQNGVQLSFSGITSIVVADNTVGSVLNFNGLSVPISLTNAANSTINVTTGMMTLAAPAGGSVNLGTLAIANAASVVLTGATSSQPATLNVSNLSIAPTGHFDIGNNVVYINYGSAPDPIATIAGYIQSGYAGGLWTGVGIDSSVAATHSNYGVGFADSADAGNPAGLPVSTLKIMYTLLGDTDLNGVVNGVDFGVVAARFNQSGTAWDQGDFNYDGVVNGVDFGDLSANFNQGVSLAAAVPPSAPAATNTPATGTPTPVPSKPARRPTPAPKHRKH